MVDDIGDENEHGVTDDDLVEFNADFEKVSFDDLDSPPKGIYIVNTDKAELIRSRAGNPMIRRTLRVLGPTCVGQLLFYYNTWTTEANRKWLKRDLHMAGIELGKLSDLPGRLSELLDVVLQIRVTPTDNGVNIRILRRVEAPPDVSGDELGTF